MRLIRSERSGDREALKDCASREEGWPSFHCADLLGIQASLKRYTPSEALTGDELDGLLFQLGVCLAAYRAAPVGHVKASIGIAKERAASRAPVLLRCGRHLVFGRCAYGARTDNHVTNRIAILDPIRQVRIEKPGGFSIAGAAKRRTH